MKDLRKLTMSAEQEMNDADKVAIDELLKYLLDNPDDDMNLSLSSSSDGVAKDPAPTTDPAPKNAFLEELLKDPKKHYLRFNEFYLASKELGTRCGDTSAHKYTKELATDNAKLQKQTCENRSHS